MTTPTDNHRLSAEPRLELVGGEWKQRFRFSCRFIGLYYQKSFDPREFTSDWKWNNLTGFGVCISEGTAPTREAAIAAAEAALLEEIGKFVRIAQ